MDAADTHGNPFPIDAISLLLTEPDGVSENKYPSSVPKYTEPSPGFTTIEHVIGLIATDHTFPPVFIFNAQILNGFNNGSAFEPTYICPLAKSMAGVDTIGAETCVFHNNIPDEPFTAYTNPVLLAKYTVPSGPIIGEPNKAEAVPSLYTQAFHGSVNGECATTGACPVR